MTALGGVCVHPQHLRTWEQIVELLLHLLSAGAHVLHDAAADGAGVAGSLRVAAVVAHQPPIGGVIRQRHAAAGTLRHMAALPAQQIPAAAPAVQQQDALLSPPQVFLQLSAEDLPHHPGVARPDFLFQVRHQHLRQCLPVISPAQQRLVIDPMLRVPGGLHRRSGRPQDQGGLVPGAEVFGHVPGVIPGRVFRLIAALLLLVQDDQAHVFQRGEDGGPGAQHHLDLAPADTLPLVVALRHPQGAVEHGHLVPKTGGEPPHHLGRQHDLRHQDHGPPPPAQYFLNQTEIDLGLAAAGDALEQHRLRLPGLRQGPDTLKGRLLFLIEDDRTAGFHRRQVRQPQLLFR